MDKKPMNRSTQIQSKAAGDCKKLQDTNYKPFPRNNRRRENNNDQKVKNEPQKKNAGYSRAKGPCDRRTRNRFVDENLAGGSEVTGVEEDEPELGSVFSPGSKKQNLNHLLNFMYSPREAPRGSGVAAKFPIKRFNYARPANRDMFLQANCQFIVSANGNYSKQLWDPDIPVPWDLIHQVVVRTEECGSCPVCLHNPVAARATRCGHVYCAPCVLHYLAQADSKQPPCPVCHQPIASDELKSARIEARTRSDLVTMVRLRRQRGTAVVTVDDGVETDSSEMLPSLTDKPQPYARLIAATRLQVQEIYERETQELKDQIMKEIDTSEIFYIEQSLDQLKQQEIHLSKVKDFENHAITKQDEPKPELVIQTTEVSLTKYDWFDEETAEKTVVEQFENMNINSKLNDDSSEVLENKVNETEPDGFETKELSVIENNCDVESSKANDKSKYFYFYQAEDGSPIFLHSVNVRLLQAAWGELSAAPARFTARVLHRSAHTVTQQTRSRAPYTKHLPLHTPYEVLELDLKPPTVTKDSLDLMKDELEKRAKARRAEKRREKSSKVHSKSGSQTEVSYYGGSSSTAPDMASDLHFPHALAPSQDSVMTTTSESETLSAQPSKGPSFATMASSSGMWRVRPTIIPCQPTLSVQPAIDNQDPEEARAPAALNLSDAIFAALSAPRTTKKKRGKNK